MERDPFGVVDEVLLDRISGLCVAEDTLGIDVPCGQASEASQSQGMRIQADGQYGLQRLQDMFGADSGIVCSGPPWRILVHDVCVCVISVHKGYPSTSSHSLAVSTGARGPSLAKAPRPY